MPLQSASRPAAVTVATTAIAVSAALAAMALVAAPMPASAVEPPSSLRELLAAVPAPPADVQAAAAWIDKASGQVALPQLTSLLSRLQAHQRALEAIAHADDGRRQAQSAAQRDDLARGMSDIGIDAERMQRDPAYAKQVQERMRTMPPAQLMAIAQRMNQPMQRDARLSNEAAQAADESAAVRAAGDSGEAFSHGQFGRMQARQALWRDADAQAARIVGAPLQTRLSKPHMEWDNPGCDVACDARWKTYAAEVLPLMVARENEALRVRRAALQTLREAMAPEIQSGDRQLAAAQYGAAARSQTYLLRIAAYDATLAGEIRQLADWTAEAAHPAAALAHCGQQAVLAPGTVCR
jgi:hypothetical protein